MNQLMIKDAQLRLNKYQPIIDNLKEQLKQTMIPEHIQMLEDYLFKTNWNLENKTPKGYP